MSVSVALSILVSFLLNTVFNSLSRVKLISFWLAGSLTWWWPQFNKFVALYFVPLIFFTLSVVGMPVYVCTYVFVCHHRTGVQLFILNAKQTTNYTKLIFYCIVFVRRITKDNNDLFASCPSMHSNCCPSFQLRNLVEFLMV